MGDCVLARQKIIIVTDAWHPQVNGVVTTYHNIINHLPHDVVLIEPSQFPSRPAPYYPSISLAWCSLNRMQRLLLEHRDSNTRLHIATEGPLGFQARRVAHDLHWRYTTAYHTKFPEFIEAMTHVPAALTRWYFDWFHQHSHAVMMSSESNRREHAHWAGVVLNKGIDPVFEFSDHAVHDPPRLLYVGRVSREKNLDAFCDLDISSEKTVVGDGPYLHELRNRYPCVRFVGYKFGAELASYYQQADVMVFPSRLDTFGIVMLESMACGTPCAAYPVTGPRDQIQPLVNGSIHEDLATAVRECLLLPRSLVQASVAHKSWQRAAQQFLQHTVPIASSR